MRIRPATTADCRAIAEVHVASWQQTYDGLLPKAVIERQSVDDRETLWRRTLERDPRLSDVFVAEQDGAVVGFVASGPRRGDALKEDGEIYALYLLRAHQRRGVGRALCKAAAQRLRERGLRSAAAWVLRENEPARRFYERIGGRAAGERSMTDDGATLVEVAYGWNDLGPLADAERNGEKRMAGDATAISIAPFVPADRDGVAQLIVGIQRGEFGIAITYDDQPDLKDIPGFYQTGDGNFWVARSGAAIVGTISLKDIGNAQVALRKMFVDAAHRGRAHGVAQALLDTSIAWARERGVRDIFLGTTAKFLAAHRFYEKNGFTEIDPDTLPAGFPRMAVDTKFYVLSIAAVRPGATAASGP